MSDGQKAQIWFSGGRSASAILTFVFLVEAACMSGDPSVILGAAIVSGIACIIYSILSWIVA